MAQRTHIAYTACSQMCLRLNRTLSLKKLSEFKSCWFCYQYQLCNISAAAQATDPTTTEPTTPLATTTTTTTIPPTTMTTTCSYLFYPSKQFRSTTLQEYTGVTADVCKMHCDQRSDCNGVSHNVGSGLCLIIQIGNSQSSSSPSSDDWHLKSC